MKKIRLNNTHKLFFLFILVITTIVIYQFMNINPKYFSYAMKIRTPKLLAMMIAAFCIGTASIAFQSIINNTIVTPCLLGMNSLYSLIHTSVVFVLGSTSIFVTVKNLSYMIDLVLMGLVATIIYSYLFRKTKHNVLYVLLTGTVMSTLFTSISSTLIRVMDPNEYETLQNSLIPGFNRVNSEIILFSVVIIILIALMLYREWKLLDVITLGKNQAINLGVDYDKTIRRLLLGITLYIAIATAMVGPISFLGLIIANLSRQLFKTYKHSYLMLGSAFFGIFVLLLGQSLIEHVFEYSATINVFVSIFGGTYFLFLIWKGRKG